jgi:hypothetical protein
MLDVRCRIEQSRVGQLQERARKRFNTSTYAPGGKQQQQQQLRQTTRLTPRRETGQTPVTPLDCLIHFRYSFLLSPALHVHNLPVTAERLMLDSNLPSHSNFSAALRIALSPRPSIRRRCEHCPLASSPVLQGCVAPHSLRQPCQL